MVLAFAPGFPSGPELLVLLTTLAMYVAVPLVVVIAVYSYLDGKRGYERRIASLERRVAELEDDRS